MGLPRSEALELAAQSKLSLYFNSQIAFTKARICYHSCLFLAMQGAARMVMQTGMHPAAIKDSVTSTSLFILSLFLHLITWL